MSEYVDSLKDFPDTARRIFNSVLREMIEDPIEVIWFSGATSILAILSAPVFKPNPFDSMSIVPFSTI